MDYLDTILHHLRADFRKHPHLNLAGRNNDTYIRITTYRGDDISIAPDNVATGRGVIIRLHTLGKSTANALLWDHDEDALIDAAVATAQRMIRTLAVAA